MRKQRWLACALLLWMAGLVNASPAQTIPLATTDRPDTSRPGRITEPRGEATVMPEGLATMKLSAGSLVSLRIFEEPDLDGSYRLDGKGDVAIPLAGDVHLQGLTLREAEAAIASKLVNEQVLNSPHVVLNIDEYGASNITVLGEVSTPGRFPALTPRKLLDVLALAGGLTSFAGSEFVLHRSGAPDALTETIHYKRGVNDAAVLATMVAPGDSVVVKRAGVVYVLGAVNRPGGYLMQESGDLDLAQAIALALGTAPEASADRIRILRKQADGSVAEINASLSQIAEGKARPLNLLPEDVVYVPTSRMKSAFFNGRQVLSSAASSTIYTLR